jgi:hypothetical protein
VLPNGVDVGHFQSRGDGDRHALGNADALGHADAEPDAEPE